MCILTSYRKNCDSFQQFQYIHSLILWNASPLRAPVGGYGKGRNSRQQSRTANVRNIQKTSVLGKMETKMMKMKILF